MFYGLCERRACAFSGTRLQPHRDVDQPDEHHASCSAANRARRPALVSDIAWAARGLREIAWVHVVSGRQLSMSSLAAPVCLTSHVRWRELCLCVVATCWGPHPSVVAHDAYGQQDQGPSQHSSANHMVRGMHRLSLDYMEPVLCPTCLPPLLPNHTLRSQGAPAPRRIDLRGTAFYLPATSCRLDHHAWFVISFRAFFLLLFMDLAILTFPTVSYFEFLL